MHVKNLYGLTAGEIFELIGPFKFTHSHALSVANSLYKKKIKYVSNFPKLPEKLKDLLLTQGETGYFPFLDSRISEDRSVKYLFRSNDGKQYETVYIPDGKRHTVCVSTQSGCRMGCPFCVSGSYGFHGNLTAGEIINQIVSIPHADIITHVVFMGMGEPLDNIENVLKACEILTAQWGFALSPRNVTVSTVGITPGIELFLRSTDCNLTLSLHSPFAAERKHMVPAENKYPSADIIRILKEAKLKKGRRLTVAYVMINGLNDTLSHLEELILMLRGSAIRVNLLPYHAVNDDTRVSSSPEKMQYFKHNLIISGISASVRKSRGSDISAACGLLAAGLKTDTK